MLTGAEHRRTSNGAGRGLASTSAMTPPRRSGPPGGQGAAPHAAREREPSKIRWALADFYQAVADAHLPEATRLAGTINGGGPPAGRARTGITNARTEGFNRIIKQTKRVGCGFRNMINYQRRILTHIAVTRPRWSTA